jgi:hypothetical protein
LPSFNSRAGDVAADCDDMANDGHTADGSTTGDGDGYGGDAGQLVNFPVTRVPCATTGTTAADDDDDAADDGDDADDDGDVGVAAVCGGLFGAEWSHGVITSALD